MNVRVDVPFLPILCCPGIKSDARVTHYPISQEDTGSFFITESRNSRTERILWGLTC